MSVDRVTTRRKNIVLLSDGTGNAASRVWRTNVWRVFQALDLTNSRQVAMYDDGVGSSSFKPLALIGGMFGWGLKRNVLDLYRFLCRNYEPGARIYVFGFSRGAYTVRVLLGLVAHQGIVRYETESELRRRAVAAYRAYRKARFHSVWRVETVFRAVRDRALRVAGRRYERSDNIPAPLIRFAGLWDTVAAYGLPIEEMTRGVNQWIWPLELPDRKLSMIVERACHALALDDERTTFHPVLWSEREETPPPPDWQGRRWTKDERVSQVWFAGSHSNVGGGYPDDSLAHVSLTWIMEEAALCGLRFKATPDADPDAALSARSSADKDGRLYDSRHGLAGYYRYGPRKIYELCHRRSSRRHDDEVTIDVPKVHESAIDRTVNGAHGYAPIGLPARYAVVMRNGEILEGPRNRFESPAQAQMRAEVQEHVWDLVWWRRLVYFVTLGASAYLLLFPLLHQTVRAHEFSTPLRHVSNGVRLLGAVLPGFAGWWIDAFAANPGRFLAGIIFLVACMTAGVALGSRISGAMHAMWRKILRQGATPAGSVPTGFVYRLRTHRTYRAVHAAMKRHIVPFVSAVLLLYLGAAFASHVAFDVADASGAFCREGTRTPLTSLERTTARETQVQGFAAASMCWPTGVELVEGRRYRITITQPDDWRDRAQAVDLGGFEIGELPDVGTRLRLFAGLPLRRMLYRPWFRPIARIGAVGADEYPLDPDTRPVPSDRMPAAADAGNELVAEINARRTGELFLYVNDAVLGVPPFAGAFYGNNGGRAQVEVARLGRR
jgi:uncharacterized protein (DUF2235 family)